MLNKFLLLLALGIFSLQLAFAQFSPEERAVRRVNGINKQINNTLSEAQQAHLKDFFVEKYTQGDKNSVDSNITDKEMIVELGNLLQKVLDDDQKALREDYINKINSNR